MRFQIVEYSGAGEFSAVISGLGRNKGKWDADHSRAAAYRHAAKLRAKYPGMIYKVVEQGAPAPKNFPFSN